MQGTRNRNYGKTVDREGRKSAGLLALALLALPVQAAEPVKFNRDIRPIMSDTCFRCHGPDRNSRMAGLRLDLREEALKPNKKGVAPIVPGDPGKSLIIQRIFADTPARLMPPPQAHKELTAAQKDTIRHWVAEGAQYEGHWAYEPVRRPAVPAVAAGGAPVDNAIDAFIQSRLQREGLAASPEADRRTLLRRVMFDLTGVPPTAEEMQAFLQDNAPHAYERVVDRLLASPRYAEVMAMRWLDAVRYADSAGFHGDNLWPAWPYRDYVLRAFRDNKPFDQFTREQLAGDLLPDAGVDAKIASAYNRLNRSSAEGGLQPKEYLAKYGADRVRTLSTVWLGITTGCAECHDHKFDPIKQKDFYAMKAFFADIRETGLVMDRGPKAWGAVLPLPTEEQQQRLSQVTQQLQDARQGLEARLKPEDERRWAWEEQTLKAYKAGAWEWRYQRPLSASSANGATLTVYNDEPVDFNFYLRGSLASEHKPGEGLVVASGRNPDEDTYTVRVKPGKGTWTALALDIHQDESLPGNRLARGADRFVLTEVQAEAAAPEAAPVKLPFVLATTTGFGQPVEHPAMAAIDGNAETGWGVAFGEHRNAFLALRFSQKITTGPDDVVTVRLQQTSPWRRATIGRFRLALSSAEYSWPESGDSNRKSAVRAALKGEMATLNVPSDRGLSPEVLKALETEEADRSEEQRKLVWDTYVWASPALQEWAVRIAKLEGERDLLEGSIPRVLVTERARPRATRVLARGNFLDESGEMVSPAVPEFLGHVADGRRANRLDLANWIVSPQNPLTARVFVNRMWRQYFGTGFSKVLEDLGSQGEWPTHPELLDWLAAEFMQPEAGGLPAWNVRNLVRTIVTSHTYRQSSSASPAMEQRDPDNRLLARQSRFRIDAEFVHDTALSISGLLVDRFGGPSVRPYQPEGYLAAMNFPKREYSAGHGQDLYRRALYTQWQRTFLHPSLAAFDAPTREECAVNRVLSNTPLQALELLNDPIFVEAARVFAQRVMPEGKTFDQRLNAAFQHALNRAPDVEERRILTGLYRRAVAQYKGKAADAAQLVHTGEAPVTAADNTSELAAMTTVTRAILNLHETITRN